MDVDRYLRNNMDDADYAEASAELEAYWQGAYQDGRRAGAEDMRERAAKVIENSDVVPGDCLFGVVKCIADEIRALPVEE